HRNIIDTFPTRRSSDLPPGKQPMNGAMEYENRKTTQDSTFGARSCGHIDCVSGERRDGGERRHKHHSRSAAKRGHEGSARKSSGDRKSTRLNSSHLVIS